MGTVQVDPDARIVVVTGFVNQAEGAIELIACGPGGKTHESVFVMQAHAMDLQTALLLLGLEPGLPHEELGQGPPRGPRVDVWVTWTDADGAVRAHPAELFAYNIETGRVLPHTGWAFTGSVMIDGQFKALAEESYLVTFWDPWAILNIMNNEVGPDDELLAVNRALVPPPGTTVTFLLVPFSDARKKQPR
ncbi:MAG TPA: YdjY domain-containing protein [Kiritimatiellia bacterium]|nr:YdjY domain-containing protein [Kiritimatiellia bacterium]